MNINIIGNNNYLDLLSSNGFSSLINVYLRVPGKSKNACIDYIFIKLNENKYCLDRFETSVLQIDFSDYYITIISVLAIIQDKQKSDTFESINYKMINNIFNDEKRTD